MVLSKCFSLIHKVRSNHSQEENNGNAIQFQREFLSHGLVKSGSGQVSLRSELMVWLGCPLNTGVHTMEGCTKCGRDGSSHLNQ